MSALLTYFALVVNTKKRYHDGNCPSPPPNGVRGGPLKPYRESRPDAKVPEFRGFLGQERTPQGRQCLWPCPSTNVPTSSGSTASLYPPPTAESACSRMACIM